MFKVTLREVLFLMAIAGLCAGVVYQRKELRNEQRKAEVYKHFAESAAMDMYIETGRPYQMETRDGKFRVRYPPESP